MKQKFSKKWKASKQRRKQVKYRENAPLHLRHKFLASNLSKELRKRYGRRSFPIRKGDTIKVMRGKFKGKKGKISNVNLQKLRVSVEGIQRQKKDGTKVNVFFNTSKLQIQELNLDDKEREKALKKLTGEKAEKGEKEKQKEKKENKKQGKKEKKEEKNASKEK